MANTKSTVRTTTIRISEKPKTTGKKSNKSPKKGKPLSEREKRRIALAKARAKEEAARKARRRKARRKAWLRLNESGLVHWTLTALCSVALILFFYYFFIRP